MCLLSMVWISVSLYYQLSLSPFEPLPHDFSGEIKTSVSPEELQ